MMNKIRKKILKCLYEAYKARPSMSQSLNYVKDHTNIDIKRIKSETDYLCQKNYIEKNRIETSSFSADSLRITVQGIDIIESHKFPNFFKIIKRFWWVISVAVPTVIVYLDFLGVRTKFLVFLTKFWGGSS